MPSTNQASTNSEPIPEWRQEIRTDIGEDPGRWLDQDLVEDGPNHTDRTMQRAVHARIKGIRSRDVIDAWQTVELRLDRDECPRQQIIAWLNRRDLQLKQRGPNPRLDRRAPGEPDDVDEAPTRVHDDCGTVVEPREGPGWRCPECGTLTRSVSTAQEVTA